MQKWKGLKEGRKGNSQVALTGLSVSHFLYQLVESGACVFLPSSHPNITLRLGGKCNQELLSKDKKLSV